MTRESSAPLSHSFISSTARLRDYWDLTKPRLVFLVLLSTIVGFFLAAGKIVNFSLLFFMLTGTAFVAGGSMVLNQWIEREEDARMPRTAKRPLPSGKLEPIEALTLGVILSIAGLVTLEIFVNSVCTLLAVMTLASYLFIYTPLKRKTSLCTIVGAVPGALPPLIGWSAVRGNLSFEAWILFSILFLWQLPHFLAIVWLYRKEYEGAGFCMLSLGDNDGKKVSRQILLYTVALLPVSLLPTFAALTGRFYFFGALLLGLGFIVLAVIGIRRLDQKARSLFLTSVLYLTFLLILMLADKK